MMSIENAGKPYDSRVVTPDLAEELTALSDEEEDRRLASLITHLCSVQKLPGSALWALRSIRYKQYIIAYKRNQRP